MKIFVFLIFIPFFCSAGLEDRKYESDKTELVVMLKDSLQILPTCTENYRCDNIFQIGLDGNKISIELWTDKYNELSPTFISKCVEFYFKKNKFFDIHLNVFDKQKTGSIREMLAKPSISLNLGTKQHN